LIAVSTRRKDLNELVDINILNMLIGLNASIKRIDLSALTHVRVCLCVSVAN
jgi:hypothetical protein